MFTLLIFSVTTNVADIKNMLVAIAAAEVNQSDLTDSIRQACTFIDTLGTGTIDCCLSGAATDPYGDRDKFICVSTAVATAVGINTGTSCQVCPAGIIT